jgi:4'-phosphopantetheinyl transferase
LPLIQEIRIDEHTRVGVWSIQESSHELRPLLIFSKSEEEFMFRVTNEDRRTQWMASRVLLKTLLDTTEFVDIYVDEFGKPDLQNFEYRMSISHTAAYSAVILSDRYNVGIDIESVRQDLDRIKQKFMRPDELATLPEKNYLPKVLLYWSAKEVMYKIYARRKLDFREHMGLFPFELGKDGGRARGWVKKGDYDREFEIEYRRNGNYFMVYAIDLNSDLE